MLTAIHIGTDPLLLRTRTAVLESAGLRVISAESVSQALGTLWDNPFDLAVLCHSLSRSERLSLTTAIRRRSPSALILLISAGPGASTAEKDGMDAVLEPDPHRLLQRLRPMLWIRQQHGAETRLHQAHHA
ncbi:MAG TPA: response regulator [Acidobacteriaceae bacterium]|nr:response regulator [Acidobacteriaceae bacterium]